MTAVVVVVAARGQMTCTWPCGKCDLETMYILYTQRRKRQEDVQVQVQVEEEELGSYVTKNEVNLLFSLGELFKLYIAHMFESFRVSCALF